MELIDLVLVDAPSSTVWSLTVEAVLCSALCDAQTQLQKPLVLFFSQQLLPGSHSTQQQRQCTLSYWHLYKNLLRFLQVLTFSRRVWRRGSCCIVISLTNQMSPFTLATVLILIVSPLWFLGPVAYCHICLDTTPQHLDCSLLFLLNTPWTKTHNKNVEMHKMLKHSVDFYHLDVISVTQLFPVWTCRRCADTLWARCPLLAPGWRSRWDSRPLWRWGWGSVLLLPTNACSSSLVPPAEPSLPSVRERERHAQTVMTHCEHQNPVFPKKRKWNRLCWCSVCFSMQQFICLWREEVSCIGSAFIINTVWWRMLVCLLNIHHITDNFRLLTEWHSCRSRISQNKV